MGDAITYAGFVKNRIVHTTTDTIPYHALYKQHPDFELLKPFGCKVLVKRESTIRKRQTRAIPCVFLGYKNFASAGTLNCLSLITRKPIQGYFWTAKFFPNEFPFEKLAAPNNGFDVPFHPTFVQGLEKYMDPTETQEEGGENDERSQKEGGGSENTTNESANDSETVESCAEGGEDDKNDDESDNGHVDVIDVHEDEEDKTDQPRSAFERWLQSGSLDQYGCGRRRFNRIAVEKLPPIPYSAVTIPKSVKDIAKMDLPNRALWIAAMERELSGLVKRSTFIFMEPDELPSNTEILRAHFVFDKKPIYVDRSLWAKARLVADGSRQTTSVSEAYSPTLPIPLALFIIAVGSFYNMEIVVGDVKAAYLYAAMESDLALKFSYPLDLGGKVAVLAKSIYGLKNSGKLWYKHLAQILCEFGLQVSLVHDCLFYLVKDAKLVLIIGLYVDDILLCYRYDYYQKLQAHLDSYISVKYEELVVGQCVHYLSLRLTRTESGFFVDMQEYIDGFVKELGFAGCHSKLTPLPSKVPTVAEPGTIGGAPFLTCLGKLGYACYVRFDIDYARSLLSGLESVSCMKRSIRYLTHTSELGLHFVPGDDSMLQLTGYVDANYEPGKSYAAYIVCLNGTMIAHRAARIRLATTSSTECEVVAFAEIAKVLVYHLNLLHSMHLRIRLPAIVYSDSLPGINSLGHAPGSRKPPLSIENFVCTGSCEQWYARVPACQYT